MKYTQVPIFLIICWLLGSCSDDPDAVTSIHTDQEIDLHRGDEIKVVRSNDGLERTIRVYSDEWLGDRYSPPKFECEASSIGRLLRFLAEKSQAPITSIEGEELFPGGTYLYSFGDRVWDNERLIFNDVVKATEEAFGLSIVVTNSGDNTSITVTK